MEDIFASWRDFRRVELRVMDREGNDELLFAGEVEVESREAVLSRPGLSS
jgi:hypothetical protein